MFSVPNVSSVAESDSMLTVCVTMATEPPGATIANQVVVSLSTMDGTGITTGFSQSLSLR